MSTSNDKHSELGNKNKSRESFDRREDNSNTLDIENLNLHSGNTSRRVSLGGSDSTKRRSGSKKSAPSGSYVCSRCGDDCSVHDKPCPMPRQRRSGVVANPTLAAIPHSEDSVPRTSNLSFTPISTATATISAASSVSIIIITTNSTTSTTTISSTNSSSSTATTNTTPTNISSRRILCPKSTNTTTSQSAMSQISCNLLQSSQSSKAQQSQLSNLKYSSNSKLENSCPDVDMLHLSGPSSVNTVTVSSVIEPVISSTVFSSKLQATQNNCLSDSSVNESVSENDTNKNTSELPKHNTDTHAATETDCSINNTSIDGVTKQNDVTDTRVCRTKVDIRLIDFAHATHKGMGDTTIYSGPDEGMMLGLKSLINIFSDIKAIYTK